MLGLNTHRHSDSAKSHAVSGLGKVRQKTIHGVVKVSGKQFTM